ncbi:flavin oxidoreductase [Clostridium beijerinckii]|nr:flavin oxidoreductase [Clostridium beijerinckii]
MKKDFGTKTIVTPLPVLIVATYDENGIPDAMNVAWGGQCGGKHVALNLSKHKTTDNLQLKKAFTVSFADKKNLVIADYFGLESGKDADKITKAGVHVTKSIHVDAPIIDEFPLTLECKVVSMNEELGELRVVGEVVNMSADESIIDENDNIDFDKLQPLSFDSATGSYRVLGEKVGNAFKDGAVLK